MTPEDAPEDTGIYLLTCAVTGDTYVGQAKCFRARCRTHCIALRDRHCKSIRWSRIIQKRIGPESFTFKVLERCDAEDLDDREMHWMEKLSPTLNTQSPRGYVNGKARLQLEVEDGLMTRLRVAHIITGLTIRTIVADALEAWLNAHNVTEDKLRKLSK